MRFSIVTIVYNDVANIGRTIDSVLGQDFGDVEYIVVDGESSDGTSDVVAGYGDRISTYVRGRDRGIYDAMNKGLKLAKGDYVLFMNSGDVFSSSDVLSRIAGEMGGGRPMVVYGDYRECRCGVVVNRIPCRGYSKIWWGPVTSHQSMFYNLGFLRGHGLSYDESYRIGADYRLTLEAIVKANGNVLRTGVCVSDFDVSGASNVHQNEGLRDANRARREVLGWGGFRCGAMTCLLLAARYAKRYFRPLYNVLRG